MRYGSVCSGIEAATVAWHPLGWTPVFFSEIEKFPSELLAHYYPNVPNYGDMRKFEEWGYDRGSIDVLVGGTPCQSFSIAGLRGGLDDDRGNLSLTYMRMVDRLRPRWTVWENVPGVLSSNGGRDFGSIVGSLAELGYSCAWRVLDAQNFGVPQRRRRVFLVGCSSGDWRDPASVLFESGCGGRDFETGRETRQEDTGSAVKCFAGNVESKVAATVQTTMHDYSRADGFNTVLHAADIAPSITSSGPPYSRTGNQRVECEALVAIHQSDKAHALGRNQGQKNVLAFDAYNQTVSKFPTALRASTGGGTHDNTVMQNRQVRRLTPTEAERLQGFPDGYTDFKEKTPDAPRYKALGNSMAVPVMRWIGERIENAGIRSNTLYSNFAIRDLVSNPVEEVR